MDGTGAWHLSKFIVSACSKLVIIFHPNLMQEPFGVIKNGYMHC